MKCLRVQLSEQTVDLHAPDEITETSICLRDHDPSRDQSYGSRRQATKRAPPLAANRRWCGRAARDRGAIIGALAARACGHKSVNALAGRRLAWKPVAGSAIPGP